MERFFPPLATLRSPSKARWDSAWNGAHWLECLPDTHPNLPRAKTPAVKAERDSKTPLSVQLIFAAGTPLARSLPSSSSRRTLSATRGGAPVAYASTPGVVERTHCGRCGSPISYESKNEFALYACTLDDPTQVTPTYHVLTAEQLPWLEIADDLPRYEYDSRNATPVSYGPRPT